MSDFTNITLNEMPLEGLLKQGGRFDNSMRVVAKPSGSAREETEMAELKAQGVCDFCGEACNADMQGAKAYDCDDFPMPMTGAMSFGSWGACPACAELIDSEQWQALEDRMTNVHRQRFGFMAELKLPMLRQMHAQQVQLFRRHRVIAAPGREKGEMQANEAAALHGSFSQGGTL